MCGYGYVSENYAKTDLKTIEQPTFLVQLPAICEFNVTAGLQMKAHRPSIALSAFPQKVAFTILEQT